RHLDQGGRTQPRRCRPHHHRRDDHQLSAPARAHRRDPPLRTAPAHRTAGGPTMTVDRLDVDTTALSPRPRLTETWNQAMGLASRAPKHMRREPEQFSDVLIQPSLFTAMFGFIFGGAISGDVANYLPIMVPGILAMTCLTASMATGVQLREDMDSGIFDRFKNLPVAR